MLALAAKKANLGVQLQIQRHPVKQALENMVATSNYDNDSPTLHVFLFLGKLQPFF